MSPSRIVAGGCVSMRRPTIGMSVPRWIGMARACASVSPARVKRLAEASSPSLTIGEKALRTRVDCISLAMPSSLLRTTSRVTGSKSLSPLRIGSSLALQQQIAVSEDPAAPARLDQGRRVVLLDDGGAGDRHAGRHGGTVVDGGRHGGALGGDADRPQRLQRRAAARRVGAVIE